MGKSKWNESDSGCGDKGVLVFSMERCGSASPRWHLNRELKMAREMRHEGPGGRRPGGRTSSAGLERPGTHTGDGRRTGTERAAPAVGLRVIEDLGLYSEGSGAPGGLTE